MYEEAETVLLPGLEIFMAQLGEHHTDTLATRRLLFDLYTAWGRPESAREFVVETSDGGFAAFTLTWHDHVNRTGHFEPVGTHGDHRRKGLARALLMFGLRAMAEAGMAFAIVGNLGDNNASRALYLGAGFEPWHLIDSYTKPIPG